MPAAFRTIDRRINKNIQFLVFMTMILSLSLGYGQTGESVLDQCLKDNVNEFTYAALKNFEEVDRLFKLCKVDSNKAHSEGVFVLARFIIFKKLSEGIALVELKTECRKTTVAQKLQHVLGHACQLVFKDLKEKKILDANKSPRAGTKRKDTAVDVLTQALEKLAKHQGQTMVSRSHSAVGLSEATSIESRDPQPSSADTLTRR